MGDPPCTVTQNSAHSNRSLHEYGHYDKTRHVAIYHSKVLQSSTWDGDRSLPFSLHMGDRRRACWHWYLEGDFKTKITRVALRA